MNNNIEEKLKIIKFDPTSNNTMKPILEMIKDFIESFNLQWGLMGRS